MPNRFVVIPEKIVIPERLAVSPQRDVVITPLLRSHAAWRDF